MGSLKDNFSREHVWTQHKPHTKGCVLVITSTEDECVAAEEAMANGGFVGRGTATTTDKDGKPTMVQYFGSAEVDNK